MNRQLYPPPPGNAGFLKHLAKTTKDFYEKYINKKQLDPNVVVIASTLSSLVEHLRIKEEQKSSEAAPQGGKN